MKYNKLIIVLFLSNTSLWKTMGQVYYNPNKEITISQTSTPRQYHVNYAEIGQNLNNILQAEGARRENLKQHYEKIFQETKKAIYANTHLTDDNLLNEKILLLQERSLTWLGRLYSYLKMGRLKPDYFEDVINSCYDQFLFGNQAFLNVSRYKYLTLLNIKDDSLKINFSTGFAVAVRSIIDFNVQMNEAVFIVAGLSESISASDEKPFSSLYSFITNACEGNLSLYQNNWNEKKSIKEKKIYDNKIFNQEWKNTVLSIINARKNKMNLLDQKERSRFLKKERIYLTRKLGRSFMNDHFGGRKNYFQGNGPSIDLFIYKIEDRTEKISSYSNEYLFYKHLQEHCKCGN